MPSQSKKITLTNVAVVKSHCSGKMMVSGRELNISKKFLIEVDALQGDELEIRGYHVVRMGDDRALSNNRPKARLWIYLPKNSKDICFSIDTLFSELSIKPAILTLCIGGVTQRKQQVGRYVSCKEA